MDYSFPKTLYKYRTWFDDVRKRILSEREIYFSSADQFNDPFDASLPYKYADEELTSENIRKKLLEIGRRINPAMSDIDLMKEVEKRESLGIFKNGQYWKDYYPDFKKRIYSDFGIFSLTQRNDDILMWSHYSNSHNGYCIGFNAHLLFDALNCSIGQVVYSQDFPTVPMFNFQGHDLLPLLLTKSPHWKYEQEYRLIKTLFARGVKVVPRETYKEIVFGCRTSQSDKLEIIEVCTKTMPHIKFYDAVEDDSSFQLNIIPTKL